MKTVVIPSDFSAESVQLAKAVVRNSDEEVRLIFTHLFHVPDDIQDLLFSTYRKKEYEYVSSEFRKECDLLKDIYSDKLKGYHVEFFYGNKLAAFKNFLEANEASFIAYSQSYGVPKLSKSAIDALPVIKKSGIPLVDFDQVEELEESERTV